MQQKIINNTIEINLLKNKISDRLNLMDDKEGKLFLENVIITLNKLIKNNNRILNNKFISNKSIENIINNNKLIIYNINNFIEGVEIKWVK